MFNLSMWELLVVLFIVLLVFGPRKLPEMGRAIGTALREFRQAGQEAKPAAFPETADEPPRRDDA